GPHRAFHAQGAPEGAGVTRASQPPVPRRIVMSVDAVGGVWRYAMDLGQSLSASGVDTVFACFGPPASDRQRQEAEAIGTFVALDAPLDWTAQGENELEGIAGAIEALVEQHKPDLVHLNLPSQAAALDLPIPVVVASHSC